MAEHARELPIKRWAPYALGFFGLFVTRWLTNQYVFPAYAEAFAGAALPTHALKDAAVGTSALVLVALALASTWRGARLGGARLPAASLACLICGAAASLAAQAGGALPALVASACLVDVGCSLTCVSLCVGAMRMPARAAGACIAGASALAYGCRAALAGLDAQAGYLAFVLAGIGCACLALALGLREPAGAPASETPAELAVTHPTSFLPLGHKLYVSLFAFEAAYGFAITVGEFAEGAGWSPVVLALIVASVALVAAPRPGGKADWLLMACILCTLAGILSFSLGAPGAQALGSVALAAGSGLFQVLAFFTLVALGSRNPLGGLTAAAWGSAAMYLGVICGANAGHLAEGWFTDPSTASLAAAVAAFAYVAVMLVILNGFSIQRTIASVEGVSSPSASGGDAVGIAHACDQLAARHGLTAREREVLELLARGRNSPFIQETLGVSYNTARTHVRHIYEKCGFHAHQELIDEVERQAKGM